MSELIVIDYIHCISGEFLKIGKIGKIVGDKQSPRAPIYPPHTGKTRIISQTVALLCLKRSKYIKGVLG